MDANKEAPNKALLLSYATVSDVLKFVIERNDTSLVTPALSAIYLFGDSRKALEICLSMRDEGRASLIDFLLEKLSKIKAEPPKLNLIFHDPQEHMAFDKMVQPLLSMSVSSVALELSVCDLEVCGGLSVADFLDKDSESLKLLGKRFDQLSFWTTSCVLSATTSQSKVYRFFFMLGKTLLRMSNYNACGAIVAGLQNFYVDRLRLYTNLVGKDRRTFIELSKIFDFANNYKQYRAQFKEVKGFGIPYFPVHLRDLLTVKECDKDTNKDGLVNFTKMVRLAEIIDAVLEPLNDPGRQIIRSTNGKVRHFVQNPPRLADGSLQILSDMWKERITVETLRHRRKRMVVFVKPQLEDELVLVLVLKSSVIFEEFKQKVLNCLECSSFTAKNEKGNVVSDNLELANCLSGEEQKINIDVEIERSRSRRNTGSSPISSNDSNDKHDKSNNNDNNSKDDEGLEAPKVPLLTKIGDKVFSRSRSSNSASNPTSPTESSRRLSKSGKKHSPEERSGNLSPEGKLLSGSLGRHSMSKIKRRSGTISKGRSRKSDSEIMMNSLGQSPSDSPLLRSKLEALSRQQKLHSLSVEIRSIRHEQCSKIKIEYDISFIDLVMIIKQLFDNLTPGFRLFALADDESLGHRITRENWERHRDRHSIFEVKEIPKELPELLVDDYWTKELIAYTSGAIEGVVTFLSLVLQFKECKDPKWKEDIAKQIKRDFFTEFDLNFVVRFEKRQKIDAVKDFGDLPDAFFDDIAFEMLTRLREIFNKFVAFYSEENDFEIKR